MDLHTYFKLTQNTKNKEISQREWIANSCLGLSEINELEVSVKRALEYYKKENTFIGELLEDITAEAGDVCYYTMQVYENYAGLDKINSNPLHPDYMSLNPSILATAGIFYYDINAIFKDMKKYVFEIQECAKKSLYHNKPAAGDKIPYYCKEVLGNLCSMVTLFGIRIEDVLTYNIEKLKKRYPAGFVTNNLDKIGLQPVEGSLMDKIEKDADHGYMGNIEKRMSGNLVQLCDGNCDNLECDYKWLWMGKPTDVEIDWYNEIAKKYYKDKFICTKCKGTNAHYSSCSERK